jgi:hypothetical protein
MVIQECNNDVAIMMKTNSKALNDIQNGNIHLLIFEFKKKKKKKKKDLHVSIERSLICIILPCAHSCNCLLN